MEALKNANTAGDDNRLFEEEGGDEVSEDQDDQDSKPVGEEASQSWLIKPVNAAEKRLAALAEFPLTG